MQKIIDAAMEYIRVLFAADHGGHDLQHSLRVYRNALTLAEEEPGCDLLTVQLAALLHDVDDHKLFATENNANARKFLGSVQVDGETIEAICEAINSVSFSKNRGRRPGTLEGKIVQDADRLDAMGAIGIARTFAFGGQHQRPLTDSVAHFHEKLRLLKDEMNTEAGKKMAQLRHSRMVEFLEALTQEGFL